MTKPDWEAIRAAYQAGETARSIAAKVGISHTAINNRAKKEGWVKVSTGKFPPETGNQSGNTKKTSNSKALRKVSTATKNTTSSDTKPEGRKVVTNHPPFQPGNQHALKHGGYARRLLLKDEVIEDARALTLEDELFRLRAGNLTAAENIGRWLSQLDDAETPEHRKPLLENIAAAEKAMMRNTVRIESITGTLATVGRLLAATDKISLEADRLRRDAGIDDGNGERDLNDFYSDIQSDPESGA